MGDTYMIVEDSPAVQLNLSNALTKLGVGAERVDTFERGDEALAGFTDLAPDVVLLDTSLHGVDPADAVEAMLLERPQTRIVLLTELPDDHPALQEMVAFGVFGILAKPLDTEKVRAMVQKIEEERPGAGRIR